MSLWQTGPVDISLREASYDESRLALMRAHYAKRIEAGTLQGAGFLLAREGKVFAHEIAGKRTYLPDSDALAPDSIKRIASITKLFTATAIMKLVENGTLWLEQPVKTLIPEFDTPMHGGITIWNLLTHTSGLAADHGYFTEPYPVNRFELMGEKDWIVKAVLAGPVTCRPGEQWNYCSLGFAVLAEIVSRASGSHFNDFVQTQIFKPLGMSRSFLEVPEKLWPEVCLIGDWEEKLLRHAQERKWAPDGGGGVYSTLRDLFRFGQYFLDLGAAGSARIIGKKTMQEMTRNQLTGVPAFHWGKRLLSIRQGLGWGFFCDGSTVGPATYNHEGWGWSALYVDPVERFVYTSFVASPKEWDPQLMVAPRAIAFSGIG